MGYGSGHGSAPVNDDVKDDSPVEEVSPVKPKKPSRRTTRAKKGDPKEPPKDWTVAKEIALCQAWCDVSENNIARHSIKTRGFWDAVITYFEKETGSTRGIKQHRRDLSGDGVRNLATASGRGRLKEDLESSTWRRRRRTLIIPAAFKGKDAPAFISFFLHDQANIWLERLPAGSISTWEDLTTCFLAQFFPPGRTAKLRNDILMRTIDQLAGGKLRNKNAKESWALLEDLSLYDNESWKDLRDIAKLVKAISLPQDVPSTFDRRLIELENQVQRLMEAYIDPKSSQAFVEYASSRTDEAGGKWYTFKPEQNNLGDTDNPSWKSNPNLRWLKRSPQLVSEPGGSRSRIYKVFEVEPMKEKEEPEKALEDEFKDLHLNLSVLEVLAHALMYNTILDRYEESLKLGKNGTTFIQGIMPEKMKDSGLFTLPCRLGDSKPFDTLADLGSCVNLIPLYLFKKLKSGLLEETNHVFGLVDGTKSYLIGIVKNVEVHIGRLKLLDDFYVINMDKDPATPLLVGRGFLTTANAVIDYKKAKIAVGEGVTRNSKESWALLEDLALYDNKSWNDPRDFAKPVKAISLPKDVLSTSDRRLIELENQVQRLMEAHLASM
ncbi:MAK10-like protein [Tanacetum coccineum]